jgi:hypothetical protein
MLTSVEAKLHTVMPDFAMPAQYERWRETFLEAGYSRHELAQALEATGDRFALLRAAQILSTDPALRSEAHRLAGQLMQSSDLVLRWFGRYLSVFLVVRGSYSDDLEAPILAHAAIHTLHDLLVQLEPYPHNPVSLELEMRIHFSLAESYSISEEFDAMRLHASKLVTLTPSVGLKTFAFSGKVLLARALLYQGDSVAALGLFQQLYRAEEHAAFVRQSEVDLATALFWSGDFVGASVLLEHHAKEVGGPTTELSEIAHGLRTMTLRHAPRDIDFSKLPNPFSMMVQAHVALRDALQHSPVDEARSALFRQARNKIAYIAHNKETWFANFERAFATLCSLRAGDYGVAMRSLPNPARLSSQPLWVDLFTLFVTLETALRVPFAGGKRGFYQHSVAAILRCLGGVQPLALERLTPTLQLLTPYALAFVAAIGGVDEVVVAAGTVCVVNLHTRPATVYDSVGLRPIQIAEMTIESFGMNLIGSARAGGGQAEGLRSCLYKPFGDVMYWFDAVMPSRLVVGLLEAAQTDTLPDWLREACRRGAFAVGRSFGLMPALQKVVTPVVLTALELEITRALYGNSDATRVWQAVQMNGGQV